MKQQLNILLVTNFVFSIVESKYDEEGKKTDVKDGIKSYNLFKERQEFLNVR